MYLSRITFGRIGDKQTARLRTDIVEEYLAALLHNGQILGDHLFAPCQGMLVAYTRVACPKALAKRYHSQWGRPLLQRLIDEFGHIPECSMLQDDVPKRSPSWRKSSSLYLFTHAFDDTSLVCCGDSGRPIPLYRLPISDQTREDLYFWKNHYKDHDRLWLASGALEVPAYKQIADPRGKLLTLGRELCQEIEAATGKSTFCYLHRYWGRKAGEQERLCPMCGRQWRTSEKEHDDSPFWEFSFRCMRCRLVSHCANSYDDERHAAIGEYPRQRAN